MVGAAEPVGAKDPVLQVDGVILLSQFPWDGGRQTTHYMAGQFARYVPTLYVEPAPSTASPLSRSTTSRVLLGRTLAACQRLDLEHPLLSVSTMSDVWPTSGRWPRPLTFTTASTTSSTEGERKWLR